MCYQHRFLRLLGLFFILCPLLSLFGCSGSGASTEVVTAKSTKTETTETRPNTPTVLIPEASQTSVLGGEPLTIDISHSDQGYVMAKYTGSSAKANIQITGPDGINYKYFLAPSDSYAVLPLTGGNGTYQIDTYENVMDNKYTSLFKESVDITLADELLPFLYPNLYVNFSADSQAVSTASEVVKDSSSDLDAVSDVYHYIVENITYDQAKAETVASGYLPNVDETLSSKKGICFDYASLTAAMLRSQSIPTRLEIGYSGEIYHAWISVYIEEMGWIDEIIEFKGDSWTRMDPTFAAGNENSASVLKYIGDGSNYSLQYTR